MFEGFLDRALRNLVEHHAVSRHRRFFRHDFFGEMLTDCLAFTIRVGGQVNRARRPGSLFEIGNYLLVISLPGIRNDLVFRREIILDIDAQAL